MCWGSIRNHACRLPRISTTRRAVMSTQMQSAERADVCHLSTWRPCLHDNIIGRQPMPRGQGRGILGGSPEVPYLQWGNRSSTACSKSTSPCEPRLKTWHGFVSSSLLRPQVLPRRSARQRLGESIVRIIIPVVSLQRKQLTSVSKACTIMPPDESRAQEYFNRGRRWLFRASQVRAMARRAERTTCRHL